MSKDTIRFTRKELMWIERTADIESSIAINKFSQLVQNDISKFDEKDKEMLKKISTELIELYIFLKELRMKLELWDCRYDIDSHIEVENSEKEMK